MRPVAPASAPSLLVQVLYGVGEIAGSARLVLFGLFLLFFYTTVMGLPGRLVGVASAIALVWNAVVDPLIGHRSDRAQTAFGRRHGFMLVGALTIGISFWLYFSPPRGLPTLALFGWLVGFGLLVRLASSLFGVPYRALGAELSDDYDGRSSVSAVRGACGLFGLLFVSTLVFVVFFPNGGAGDPKLVYDRYPIMGLAFGALMTLLALIPTVATWRVPVRRRPADRGPGFLKGFRVAFRVRSFRIVLVAYTFVWLGIVANQILFVHFLTYYAQIRDSRSLSLLQFAFYGCALLGVPIWMRVARHAEKRTLLFVSTLVAAVLLSSVRLLVGAGHPFGTGDARPLIIGEALGGLFTSLLWIVPAAMVADVADEDELISGQRREGLLFGLLSTGDQVASAVAVSAVAWVLDSFAGLVPGQASQSALTVERIGLLYGVAPAFLLLCAGIIILRYPLTRPRVAEIQRQLAAIHEPVSATTSSVEGLEGFGG